MATRRDVLINVAMDSTRFTGGARQVASSLGGISTASVATGVAIGGVGLAVAGAVAGVTASVKAFAAFDSKLNQSLAIMGNVSAELRDGMAAAAREVGRETLFGAEQAAEAFFFLASAGLDASESIEALPRVASFAQAGMFDLATATDLATDAQSALGLSVKGNAVQNLENLTKVTDVLVKANTLANASVQQFAESLTNKAGAALRITNKDVEEGVAVLAVFADQGLKGAAAGEALSIVLRDLQKASIENADQFERFGIAVFDSAGNLRGISDIIADVEAATDGMSDAQRKATLSTLGFQERSVQNIIALLGTSDAIREYERSLRDAAGITDEVADKQLDTLSARFDILTSKVMDVAIGVGEDMAPALGDLIGLFEDMVPALEAAGSGIATMVERSAILIRFAIDASGAIGGLIDKAGELTDTSLFEGVNLAFIGNEFAIANQLRAGVDALGDFQTAQDDLAREMGANVAAVFEMKDGFDAVSVAVADASDSTGQFGDDALDAGDAASELAGDLEETEEAADESAQSYVRLADSLRETIREQGNLGDVLRETTDPIFAAVRAFGRYQEALEQADEDGERTNKEILGIAEAMIAAQAALDSISPDNLDDAIDVIAESLGFATEEVSALLEQLGILDGTHVTTVIETRNLRTGQAGGTPISLDPTSGLPGTVVARQFGGPLASNQLSVVGERGPELFVPNTAGQVIANGQLATFLGGQRTVNLTINNPTSSDVLRDAQTGLILSGVAEQIETDPTLARRLSPQS